MKRLWTAGRRAAWGAAAAALLLGASACGGAPTAVAHAPTVLTIALNPQTPLNWWPPLVPSANCGTVSGGGISGPDMYLSLLWISRTDTIEYGRSIASGITVTNHDQTYTIHMNPKWHWSNGTPVTAANVAYDWKLIKASSASNSVLPYCFGGEGGVPADWQSVTVEGPHTLVVTTTAPVNPVWFEHNGLSQLVPVPPVWNRYPNMTQELHWIARVSNQPSNPVYRVYDGPYGISQSVHDSYWTFTANPHYDGPHPAQFRKVTYLYEGSSASTFAALHRGSVDIAPMSFSLYESAKSLHGYHVISQRLFGYFFALVNLRSNADSVGGLFAHLYVRQALQMGINQGAIIQGAYHGFASPSLGPVPVHPQNVFFDRGLTNPYPYNPSRGLALLEHHGWHLQNGVLVNAQGQRFAFPLLYQTGSTSVANEAQLMKQAWGKEGIDVTLDPQSITSVSNLIGNPTESPHWAMQVGFKWSYEPDYYPSGGGLFTPTAGFNPGGYANAQMTRLIRATYAAGTPQQVAARFNAYQQYAVQQLPVLWVPTPDIMTVVKNGVTGAKSQYNAIVGETPVNRIGFTGAS